jgi:serine/threonine-protein kinase
VVGQRFGNYVAVSLLGEGGMGAVYLAEHPDIGRKVAVKVLRAEFSRDEQLLGRFLNEARAANAIRHPNIIEILDSGTTDNGMPYLVMELLEGESLSARLKRLGPLSLGDALEFAYQTASAVGAAHKKGIVHRDLKPDNLFIVPDENDPSRQRIKVLDFGIAKLQGPPRMGDAVKTRTGTLMGTPVYMSPEQCLGTREVDQRTDIYSLGVIVYEMICGQPPFYSEGFGELVNMHLNAAPPPLRQRVPAVPAPVEGLVLRALSKKPDERFADMAQMQAAIKAAGVGVDLTIKGASKPDFPGGTLPGGAARAGELGTGPTTLSTATGSRDTAAPRRGRALALIGGVVAVAAAAAFMAVGRKPPPAPSASVVATTTAAPRPVPPAAPRTVEVGVDTQPTGARVVRRSDGVALGTTPFRGSFPAGSPPAELRLEHEGYEPFDLRLQLDRNRDELIQLRAVSAPSKTVRRPRPVRRSQDDEPAKL